MQSDEQSRRTDGQKRRYSDPEQLRLAAELRKRDWARRVVKLAGFPPVYRRLIDRARELLDDGYPVQAAADVLNREFRKAA